MADQLVTVNWLKKHLRDPHLILLDASAQFDPDKTIPTAQHFDIKNSFSETKSTFPNTFPSTEQFERESRKLGINNNSHIVVFDEKGIFNSPRVWWMFKTMGHDKISVLDGGLPAWNMENLPVGNKGAILREEGNFKAHFNPNAIKSYEQVAQNIEIPQFLVIDARSAGRFSGTTPEPRAHIMSGSIKKSINLPYTEVLNNGKYKSPQELKALFNGLDIQDRAVVFSCGSGISACITLLALDLISAQEASVYDGSWTEWAEKKELFVK